jgi:ribose transport system substrate-binding protein
MISAFLLPATAGAAPRLTEPASAGMNGDATQYTIDYFVMTMEHPLFGQGMVPGAQAAAKQLGVNLRVIDANWDSNTQINQIEAAIPQHPDAMLINAVTAKEDDPAMEQAKAAGIPIVAIDTRPVGFTPDTYVAEDMFSGGVEIGELAAHNLKCTGNYATVWAVGNEQGAERIAGLKAGMQNQCNKEGLTNNLVDVGDLSGAGLPLRDTARKVTNDLLAKYPVGQLAMLFGQTDEWAVGEYLACQAASRQDVQIYGMDDNSTILSEIAEKKNLIATTHHHAIEVGAVSVQAAVDLIQHKAVPPEILFSFQLVTQNNVQYDTGWDVTKPMAPSYSNLFFPQEEVFPLVNHPYNTAQSAANPLGAYSMGATPTGAAANTSSSTSTSSSTDTLTIVLGVLVVILVLLLVVVLYWVWSRSRSTRGGGLVPRA